MDAIDRHLAPLSVLDSVFGSSDQRLLVDGTSSALDTGDRVS